VVATTIATTFEEDDNLHQTQDEALETEIGRNRVSVFTSATSFFSLGHNETIGRRIPDLSDLTLDSVQLQYGQEFECPYCRTIQIAANRFEWKYVDSIIAIIVVFPY